MQIDVDDYAFDPKRLAKFISNSLNNKEDVIEEVEALIPEINMIEGDKEITFPTNDKSRDRPKKDKSPKSITERKSQSKPKPKKTTRNPQKKIKCYIILYNNIFRKS